MVAPAVAGIDLFKIAGRSISAEERLIVWLEYHPHVQSYAPGTNASLEAGVRLVECPDCGATRSLEPHRGVLHFKAHDKRKSPVPVTSVRWTLRATIWIIVGGEHA